MFSYVLILAVAISTILADPKANPSIIAAPLAVAPAVVTAQSSQVVARQYNALTAPLVASAPLVAPAAPIAPVLAGYRVAAPYVASPYVASPYVASPYVASPYVASPYVASSPYIAAPFL